ncbi:pseudouridine synthase [Sphingobacterium lactis]|uniref:RluA family pseudouridine synthase n=1 Tax=Sphingobacterium lactis TaxID=797291 RepID=UPI003EC6682E
MGSTTFIHRFTEDVSELPLPERFTFPFAYVPHPLSRLAAEQVQQYLEHQRDFEHNFGLQENQPGLVIGKMFGVLVVQDTDGNLGFLAAVSGKMAGSNTHSYFVPPIFDMLAPDGFFLREEEVINALNHQIKEMEAADSLKDLKKQAKQTRDEQDELLASLRKAHKQNKLDRKIQREVQEPLLSPSDYAALKEDLVKQSYRDQHIFAVQKELSAQVIAEAERNLHTFLETIAQLKLERKTRSAALQNRLFDQYQFLNAHLEKRAVLDIFQEAKQLLPPAGAGECAAPKLLQYAYQHALKPICMAEFWWGESPSSEVRKHLSYYPACRGKCEPILGHMLQGLAIDPNPMLENPAVDKELEILYEDNDLIVVNKPAEFLSVPGIHIQDSVQKRIEARLPEYSGPIIIHRLDMSTSGILVLAKNKYAHQFIQDQFIKHQVQKRYTALLDGIITAKEGQIDLPLRVDLDDRPRQVVCYTYGKPALTLFKVVAVEGNRTRIHYFPQTGRTHQLRVHSAHAQGLNAPIVGDDLYGEKLDRLHLHAGYIKFIHPTTKEAMEFEVADPF